MAVGTVSGVDPQDNWQLISTTTVTAGQTSITVGSFSGYKHLLAVGKDLTGTAGQVLYVRPNNDTSAGDYTGNGTNRSNFMPFAYFFDGTSAPTAGYVEIYNVDKAIPHQVFWTGALTNAASQRQYYTNPVAITTLEFNISGDTLNSGTIYLYGIAA
jgi:hypothetical protein